MRSIAKIVVGGATGAAVAALIAVGCGGGGGGGGGGSTRIEGNVSNASAFLTPAARSSRWAWLSPVGVAWAQTTGVEVCLQGTSICTTTADDGSFVLETEGDLVNPCLTFTGVDFTGTVCVPGTITEGSVVRIDSIECSTVTGTCRAEDIDVSEPGDDDPSDEVSDEDGPSGPSAPSGPNDDVSEEGPTNGFDGNGDSDAGEPDDVSDEDDVSEDD